MCLGIFGSVIFFGQGVFKMLLFVIQGSVDEGFVFVEEFVVYYFLQVDVMYLFRCFVELFVIGDVGEVVMQFFGLVVDYVGNDVDQ